MNFISLISIYFIEFRILFISLDLGLSVYPVLFVGWISNCNYAILGSIRLVSTMISFEINLFFLVFRLMIIVESFSFIIENEIEGWRHSLKKNCFESISRMMLNRKHEKIIFFPKLFPFQTRFSRTQEIQIFVIAKCSSSRFSSSTFEEARRKQALTRKGARLEVIVEIIGLAVETCILYDP